MQGSTILFDIAAAFTMTGVHPFLTYGLSLKALSRMGAASPALPVPGGSRPVGSFAVCVCAYNEEAVIALKVENLLALRRATSVPVDIYLYVDAASDRTAALVRPFADRLFLVEATERHGKTAGMNRLAGMATADVLVFSDANVMLAPDALERLRDHFNDPEVGCVCGHLAYANGEETDTAAIGSGYWRAEERLKQLESDTGGVIGADGSLFAIRRCLHRPVPEDIIDDFYLSLAILCDGHRVIRAEDVRAFEGATTDSADEFRRKIRIACQAFNVHRLMRPSLTKLPWLLRYKYVSHKLLRWLALVNVGLGGLCFAAGWAEAQGWIVGAAVFALGLAGLMGLALLGRPREILLALLATTIGVGRSLKGDRFQTWRPPVSRDIRTTQS